MLELVGLELVGLEQARLEQRPSPRIGWVALLVCQFAHSVVAEFGSFFAGNNSQP